MYSSDSIHYFSSFSSKPYFHTSSSNHPEPTFVFPSIIPSLFNNIISHRTHLFTYTSIRPALSARLKCSFDSTKSYFHANLPGPNSTYLQLLAELNLHWAYWSKLTLFIHSIHYAFLIQWHYSVSHLSIHLQPILSLFPSIITFSFNDIIPYSIYVFIELDPHYHST